MSIDLDKTAIILNDQLGRGRSSNTAVIVLLIQRWLKQNRAGRTGNAHPPTTPRRRDMSRRRLPGLGQSKISWQIINSALRVIRNGLEVKRVVDEAIDSTSAAFNLRDAIEDFRDQAQEAKTPEERQSAIEKGKLSIHGLTDKQACTTSCATSISWSSRRTWTTLFLMTRRPSRLSRLSSTAPCSRLSNRSSALAAFRA